MKTIKDLKSLVLSVSLGLAIGAGILSVQAWTEPQLDAPGGNLGAPLNTTSTAQSKAGSLGLGAVFSPLYTLDVRSASGLGTLRTTGGAILNTGNAAAGLIVDNGSVRFDSLTNCGKLYTDASGNVTCGTDATGSGGGISGSGTTNYVPKWTTTTDLGNSQIFDNGSYVAIGTNNPGAKLDIWTNNTSQIPIRVTHNTYNDWVLQKRRSDGTQLFGIKEVNSNGGMALMTNNAERMVITRDGNVGIGTTNPLNKLHVYSTTGTTGTAEILLGSVNNSARGGMLKKNAADPYNFDFLWSVNPTSSGGDLTFYSSQVHPRVIFKADGKVGIGTTSPETMLHVNGHMRIGSYGAIGVADGNGRLNIYSSAFTNNYIQSEAASRITLHTDGITFYTAPSGTTGNTVAWTERMRVNTNGVYAGAFMYSSDQRLKYDIKNIHNSSDVLNINPVSFNWKKDGKEDVGVIAQDVEKYFPEFVKTGEDGYKSVDYPKLVVPLIGAVKEQQVKIDDLESRLEVLENR